MPVPRQEQREEQLSKWQGTKREMHLLPAAPSHQFNQEYTSALSPVAVPAQLVMGKGRGLTLGDTPAAPEERTACPAPAHVKKGFSVDVADSGSWTRPPHVSTTPQPVINLSVCQILLTRSCLLRDETCCCSLAVLIPFRAI